MSDKVEYVILPLISYNNGGKKGAVTVEYASPVSAARYAKVPPGKYVVLARDEGNVPRKVHAFTKA